MEFESENFDEFGTIEETQEVENKNIDGEDGNNQEEAEEVEEKTRQVVKPKRIIKNPRVRLNVNALLGPRGLPVVTNVLQKCKLKGKGHEREDLDKILSSYKYWCHRMSPKTPFDQAVEIIEKLGTKRPIITYLKKVRSGLIEEAITEEFVEDDEELTETSRAQQSEFDALLPQKDVENKPAELTEEQKERIRVNKERAIKLREERLKKIEQQNEQWQNVRRQNSQVSKENSEEVFYKPEEHSQVQKVNTPTQDSEDLFSQSIDRENSQLKRVNAEYFEEVFSQSNNEGNLQTNTRDPEVLTSSEENSQIEKMNTQDDLFSGQSIISKSGKLRNKVDFDRPESPIIGANLKKVLIDLNKLNKVKVDKSVETNELNKEKVNTSAETNESNEKVDTSEDVNKIMDQSVSGNNTEETDINTKEKIVSNDNANTEGDKIARVEISSVIFQEEDDFGKAMIDIDESVSNKIEEETKQEDTNNIAVMECD